MIKDTLLKFFKLDGIVNNFTEYIEARFELAKYEVKEDIIRAATRMTFMLLIFMLSAFFILFISVSAAYVFAKYVGQYAGFAIVAGFYLVLIITALLLKDPINNYIEQSIKNIFNKKKNEDAGNG